MPDLTTTLIQTRQLPATQDAIVQYCNQLLQIERWKDYCPNGLQVAGKSAIRRIVTGVSATQRLIDAAIAAQADMVLVHHGYFWKGEAPEIIGIKHRRLKSLLQHDMSLVAYHLPLDAHPVLGNNAQLAHLFGWQMDGTFGEQNLAQMAILPHATTLVELSAQMTTQLQRTPLVIGEPMQRIQRIGWCTGAAQSYFPAAIAQGVDVFISGEINEPTVHLARESGVAYVAAGHHATERYGVKALGEHLAAQCGIEVQFIDCDSPV
jgi:dinuclear metal center YbgI/SA1388 family protein